MATWARVAAVVVLLLAGAGLAAVLLRAGADDTAGQHTVACRNDDGDADRIQDAIDDSADGDEIVLAGTCLVDETIVLRGARGYRGASAATVVREARGSNLPAVLASDSWAANSQDTGSPISLRDLTIDANAKENPRAGDGVVIRSWRSQIADLHIIDAKQNCLRLTSRSQNGTDLTSTQVAGTIRGVFAQRCGDNGVYVEDKVNSVTDWNLVETVVGETGGDGIAMENAGGWTVRANHVYDAGGSGIDVFRLFATTITANYVEDFGTGSGLKAYLQGDAASVIDGNKLFQAGDRQDGVLLDLIGSSQGRSVATVTANVLVGNGTGTGLSYRTEGATLAVTSTGNSVSGVATPLTGVPPDAGY
ncbi:right-handed parallel beta-helix repeat-containing protein [Marmoricola endophyticus]|nr:right-handed parallel beta-helix repeat-containing protein [Marmoricola endophyticus]